MKLFLAFLCIVSFNTLAQNIPGDDGERIYLFEDSRDLTRFQRLTKEIFASLALEIQNVALGGKVSVFSLSNVSLGVKIKSKLLKDQKLHHDIDKLYHLHEQNNLTHRWNHFQFGTRLPFPFQLNIDDFFQGFGLTVGTEVGENRDYEFITMSDDFIKDEDRFFSAIWGHFKRARGSIKKINLKRDPRQIVNEFVGGTEITRRRKYFVVLRGGAFFNYGPLKSSAGTYYLWEFEGESTFKIHTQKGKRIVTYRLRKIKKKGSGVYTDSGVKLTLLEWGKLKGRLRANFITVNKDLLKGQEFDLTYQYDLDYPQAVVALEEAMKGNFERSQKLSINRNELEDYHGILKKKELYTKIKEINSKERYGIRLNDNYDRLLSSTVGPVKKLKKAFLYEINEKKNRNEITDGEDFYSNPIHEARYIFTQERSRNSFW